jgi:hypothetical protein
MILISHRGNLHGKNNTMENNPEYIDIAISKGYYVEIDVWCINDNFFLGHDNPEYNVVIGWFEDRINKLWIHCKNVESIVFFSKLQLKFNYFWHEEDTLTLTSLNYIWAYPGKQPIKNSIAVMPEIHNDTLVDCIGICSDKISEYNDKNNHI